jgi:hypothetical protein
MSYVTSVERLAKAEGGATVLLKQLTKVCGPLPESVQQRIQGMSIDQLAELGEALLDFHSLEDIESWFAASETAGQ